MRFMHLADVHLGAVPDAMRPWGENRKEEIWSTFEKVLYKAGPLKIDCVLISGDLFHNQPLISDCQRVNHIFSKIAPTQVVLIAGRCDYIAPESYYNTFKWAENVHFIWDETPVCTSFVLPYSNEIADVYGFSSHQKKNTRPLESNGPVKDRTHQNILIGYGGSREFCPFDMDKLEALRFDYVALGHDHRAGINEEKRIGNPGSLEPLSVKETGVHGYIYGEILPDKTCHLRFYQAAKRRYRPLRIACSEKTTDEMLQEKLNDVIHKYGKQDIYVLQLLGAGKADGKYDISALEQLGNVIVQDDTVVKYNYAKLYEETKDPYLKRYIATVCRKGMSKIEKEALYYGVRALLHAEEDKR